MKKIYFWAPYNSKIGTINSVINSIRSIKKYSSKDIKPYLLDTTSEWKNYINEYDIIFLRKNSFDFRNLKNKGFFWSRLFYIRIFLSCFFPLKSLLQRDKPDYLIVHLITSLPLIIFYLFNWKTKLILRISGEPNLNIFRKILWKLCASKIYKITCPSPETKQQLTKSKIFNYNQIEVLLDPVINIQNIINKKETHIDDFYKKNCFILSIGRLTRQKNFNFLIEAYNKLLIIKPNIKLVILGEGEEKSKLNKLIYDKSLRKNIFLLGNEENVFKYMKHAYCLILPSLYENPGHVLIEAAACNCPIISSNCPTGPSEFLDYGKGGFLFDVNNQQDFLDKFKLFVKQTKIEKLNKLIISKKKSLNYTLFRHFISLKKII